MEFTGKKFVFLGDSITEGAGVDEKDRDTGLFHSILKNEYSLKKAINYGIGGTRIARQIGDSPESSLAYCDRYDEMDSDADFVVVFGGTNDYGHGNAPIGTFESREPTTFYGGLHVTFRGLIEKYPKSTIIIMTPIHRSDDFVKSPNTGASLKEYVDIIKEVAEYYALPLLDLYANSGIQPDVEINKNLYCPDGLHPNVAGHKLIASRLAGFIKTL